ncbi:MAG: 4Fe-4S dicluster domain-containing protein [Deltaproteobacteria bacterium]|nr:4Fe-4S dicluster domain-containing protein [Deltaproteobacteria bacterium]
MKFITKTGLKALVTGLIRDYKVYGTVKKDGFPAYGEITDAKQLVLLQTPTHLSAKGFVFPERETLLRFNMEDGSHKPVVEAADQVIIGLHACDIHAMLLMDRVFAYGAPDANYLARRAKTLVIGTDCMPDEHCFCQSIGTMHATEGFDLFLHQTKNGFAIDVGTKRGAAILRKYTKAVTAAASEIRNMEAFEKKRAGSFKTRLDAPAAALPAIYARSDASPVWDRIGSICYGCGSCNNVCPTCYCFDVRDEPAANLKQGERVRVWDACTLEEFALVAGGHNFRKPRGARLRHRFNRKFRYLTDVFNAPFCVGCGRCIRTCLVNINIAEVTNELIAEDAKRGIIDETVRTKKAER